jgi:hypothetical protein
MLKVNVANIPGVKTQTVHTAFRFRLDGKKSTLETLSFYDVWLIGEVGTISKDIVNHIFTCWLQLERVPTLIFEGDFAQLPPSSEDPLHDARLSSFWPQVLCTELWSASCGRR